MRPTLRRRPRGSRGVALLLVLIVLLLVATLATEIALTARTHAQLAGHSMNEFLLRSVVDGRRQILLAALRYDQSLDDKMDTEGDPWSWHNSSTLSSWGSAGSSSDDDAPLGDDDGEGAAATTYRNRDVKILAWCEDERSKINLRGLLWEEDQPTFVQTREALVRLIDAYRENWSDLDLTDTDAREMVDQLVDWLRDKEDTDTNPLPGSKIRRGRLLSLEDVLRVPGGKWSPERLYDVRDPEETEQGEFTRRLSETAPEDADADTAATTDSSWERANGVPGLFRYLTVWGEGNGTGTPRINVNTAPQAVLEALLEPGQEDVAKAIVEHRRQGGTIGDPADTETGETPDEGGSGWFKVKADLNKVEGLGDDLTRYPRLNFFADTQSAVFSLRIVATVVSAQREGDEEGNGARDILAAYQVREVIQRTGTGAQGGTLSLYAERRQDPILGDAE